MEEEEDIAKEKNETTSPPMILVTGANGNIASWIIKLLLERNFRVRGTVRDLKCKEKCSHLLSLTNSHNLELFEASLTDSVEVWDDAVKGCTYICHVASPHPTKLPKNEQEVIRPAALGTINVLHSASKSETVRRVVVTSSVMTISTGWTDYVTGKEWTEEQWAIKSACKPHSKSKLLAEEAAWNFVKDFDEKNPPFELVTVLPSFVIGPLLSTTNGIASRTIISRLMNNTMLGGVPPLHFSFVDVRDVAEAHFRALTVPTAAGHRFICSGGSLWLEDIATILSNEFTSKGYKIVTNTVPGPLIWLLSWVDEEIATVMPLIGRESFFSNKKIKVLLDMKFRNIEDSVKEMAYSLIELGVVKKK